MHVYMCGGYHSYREDDMQRGFGAKDTESLYTCTLINCWEALEIRGL